MSELIDHLQTLVKGKHLLNHPFYQRWNAGELTRDELTEYAREYFHYSLAFPTFVSATHMNSNDVVVRQALLENLIEEERGPENHPELWLRFCDALGMSREEVLASEPSEKTQTLIDTMKGLCRDGEVHEGLAALYAYESQVPAVAQSKIDGLAKHYSITEQQAISFFTVHLLADVEHARTSEELMITMCDTEAKRDAASRSVELTLDALYGFLDQVKAPDLAIVN